MAAPSSIASEQQDLPGTLCLACGLCCNGVLFKDVELQAGDNAALLTSRGLPIVARGGKQRFAQPCRALDSCTCQVYVDRPARCRQFECLLFKSVSQGRTELAEALRIVRRARLLADRVRRLLRDLGDGNETVALSLRFRRMRARFEKGLAEEQAVDRFAELTMATHELNLLLSQAFLP